MVVSSKSVRRMIFMIARKRYLLKPFITRALTSPLPPEKMAQFLDDAVLVGKETWLQYLHPDNTIDNFEGLTLHRDDRLFVVSDDNCSPLQNTFLVYIEVLG